MLWRINKKSKGIVDSNTFYELIKAIISAFAMGVVVYFLNSLEVNVIISIAISVIGGVITYLLCQWIMKSEVISDGIEFIKKKN